MFSIWYNYIKDLEYHSYGYALPGSYKRWRPNKYMVFTDYKDTVAHELNDKYSTEPVHYFQSISKRIIMIRIDIFINHPKHMNTVYLFL